MEQGLNNKSPKWLCSLNSTRALQLDHVIQQHSLVSYISAIHQDDIGNFGPPVIGPGQVATGCCVPSYSIRGSLCEESVQRK